MSSCAAACIFRDAKAASTASEWLLNFPQSSHIHKMDQDRILRLVHGHANLSRYLSDGMIRCSWSCFSTLGLIFGCSWQVVQKSRALHSAHHISNQGRACRVKRHQMYCPRVQVPRLETQDELRTRIRNSTLDQLSAVLKFSTPSTSIHLHRPPPEILLASPSR